MKNLYIMTTIIVVTLICTLNHAGFGTCIKAGHKKRLYRVAMKLLKSLKVVLSSEYSVGISTIYFTFSTNISFHAFYRCREYSTKRFQEWEWLNQLIKKCAKRLKQIPVRILMANIFESTALYVISVTNPPLRVGIVMTIVVTILSFVMSNIKKD